MRETPPLDQLLEYPRSQRLVTIVQCVGISPRMELDDFRATGVSSTIDIAACFRRFFFGCEADDATVPLAFARATLPGGEALQPVLGSDLGHWDVRDMREVMPEAAELVDDGLIDASAFQQFTCDNPIRLHGGMNPDFFAGTVVEEYARGVLAGASD